MVSRFLHMLFLRNSCIRNRSWVRSPARSFFCSCRGFGGINSYITFHSNQAHSREGQLGILRVLLFCLSEFRTSCGPMGKNRKPGTDSLPGCRNAQEKRPKRPVIRHPRRSSCCPTEKVDWKHTSSIEHCLSSTCLADLPLHDPSGRPHYQGISGTAHIHGLRNTATVKPDRPMH